MTRFLSSLTAALLLSAASGASAQELPVWGVTFTNLTANQIISPPILVSHHFSTRLFTPGKAASTELAAVAEDADATGLLIALAADPEVQGFTIAPGPLLPGQSVTLEVHAGGRWDRLSAIGMLVTTNDAFFGLNNYILNPAKRVQDAQGIAYDAGTEANTEDCANIPGPPCGNPFVRVTDGAEGFVHVHRGLHGVGTIDAPSLAWDNPVVGLKIVRR